MKVDFNKNPWSVFVLFPTIELDLTAKEIYFVWLWFGVTIGL